jgi:hypothetical protein
MMMNYNEHGGVCKYTAQALRISIKEKMLIVIEKGKQNKNNLCKNIARCKRNN